MIGYYLRMVLEYGKDQFYRQAYHSRHYKFMVLEGFRFWRRPTQTFLIGCYNYVINYIFAIFYISVDSRKQLPVLVNFLFKKICLVSQQALQFAVLVSLSLVFSF